jgi:uncharacterized membrane protein
MKKEDKENINQIREIIKDNDTILLSRQSFFLGLVAGLCTNVVIDYVWEGLDNNFFIGQIWTLPFKIKTILVGLSLLFLVILMWKVIDHMKKIELRNKELEEKRQVGIKLATEKGYGG